MALSVWGVCSHQVCRERSKWDRRKDQVGGILINMWCLPQGTRKRIKTWPCNKGRWVGRKSEQGAAEDRDTRVRVLKPMSSTLASSLRVMGGSRHSFPVGLPGLRGWGRISSCLVDGARCQQTLLLYISRSSRSWIHAPSWTQTSICGFYSQLTKLKSGPTDQRRSLKAHSRNWIVWVEFLVCSKSLLRPEVIHVPFFWLREGRKDRNLCFSPTALLWFLVFLMQAPWWEARFLSHVHAALDLEEFWSSVVPLWSQL